MNHEVRQRLDLSLQEYEVAKILLYVQVARQEVSPAEIGALIGLTASEVGKHVNSLRDMGYYDLGQMSPEFARAHLGAGEVSNTLEECAEAFVNALNELTGSRYQAKSNTVKGSIRKLMTALPKGDVTPDSLVAVVEIKHQEWAGTDMEKYLRPSTLLRLSKFPVYLNEARATFS